MDRTPARQRAMRDLAATNDQLCYFLFLNDRFQRYLSTLSEEALDSYATELFPENPWSGQLDLRVRVYGALQRANATHTFGAYVTTAYERIRDYIVEVIYHLAEINCEEIEGPGDRAPEAWLYEVMEAQGFNLPDEAVRESIRYVRLRRNHWVHSRDELSDDMVWLLRYRGERLNRYWSQCANLDFEDEQIGEFDEWESIDLIAVLRGCMLQVDESIASALDRGRVVRRVAVQVWENNPTLRGRDAVEVRARKVETLGHMQYGLNFDADGDEAVDVCREIQRERE